MRIMIAVPCYWPSQDGVTHITKYLAEGLAARGHEVLAFTSAGNGGLQELPRQEEHNGVKIERMRVYVRWPLTLRGRDKESTRRVYLNRIRTYRPDILLVVCAQTWTLDWIIPYLDQIKCPKVFYSHGYSRLMERYPIREKLKKRNVLGAWIEYQTYCYYKKLYRSIAKFDMAIYLLEENNSCVYAKEHGLNNGKVLENAIEDEFLSDELRHEKKNNQKIQFLCVANYNENKNQKMILQAFCEAKIVNANLIFAGFEENEYLKSLRTYQKEHLNEEKGKNVRFYVHLDRSEIYQLYRDSDVFVCGSRSENAPIVHCEAAATGMAVVSTPVGNVEKMDGIFIAKDAEEIKLAMELLTGNRKELFERGERLRSYVLGKKCRISDKVAWLEAELLKLNKGK